MKNCSTFDYVKQSFRAANYWYKKVKAKSKDHKNDHPLGSADFMKEDIYVCEQLQKSFSSPHFSFGLSAENSELPVRKHQQIVWDMIRRHL